MDKFVYDWAKSADVMRRAAADGCVLLKNDGGILPLADGARVAVYGRAQFDYIRTGTGSGGMVNVPYEVNIYEGLKNSGRVILDENVAKRYTSWLDVHPFDWGSGWAGEPNSQIEMPLYEPDIERDAACNDAAVFCIGRLTGEDKDNHAVEGSFLLTDFELVLLNMVAKAFEGRLCVLVNSGNIIDMKWVESVNPAAVMYIWPGGIEGGNAVADVITGAVNPSGRLADTIAHDISDYPSTANFGNPLEAVYAEDVFVGYRYFETFARDKVMYPFGYGLSYTEFSHRADAAYDAVTGEITVNVKVTNIGKRAGREVSEVYYKACDGKICKPERELFGFAKTKVLAPNESENLVISLNVRDMASYDDGDYTGNINSFVLEPGIYEIYEGKNVRDNLCVLKINIEKLIVTEHTSEALGPMKSFKRMAKAKDNTLCWQDVPLRRTTPLENVLRERKSLTEIPYKGKNESTLADVYNGKITLDEFIAGLSDDEMLAMTRGEGMSSKRITGGLCAAFAGVTDTLESYGIPAVSCTDGPNGIRIDTGTLCMQGPCGTSLACTFDTELITEVYDAIGRELRMHKIDSLLGPGMNIHRNPLNGRNFEYFSEDPLLTGACVVAELKGFHKNRVTGTIKHFACNNQEVGRHTVDSVVSKRALREIYLKGYEMAVREGGAYLIMTSYGVLNGTHTSSSFDLNEMVLRKDWGYQGITETDWWALCNDECGEANHENTAYMVRGANDLYMVCTCPGENANNDNSFEGLRSGLILRSELQRNVRRILSVAMRTLAFDRVRGITEEWTEINVPKLRLAERIIEIPVEVEGECVNVDASLFDFSKGSDNHLSLHFPVKGDYELVYEARTLETVGDLAQVPLVIKRNGAAYHMTTLKGDNHDFITESIRLYTWDSIYMYVSFMFKQSGMELKNIRLVRV